MMENNKVSPELNIAMNVSEKERERSLDLNIGYSVELEEWELIVQYTGSLEQIRQELGISVVELLGGYAIIRIPQNQIGRLSEYPQINYIEKPKNLLFEEMEGIVASCVNPVRISPYQLTGKGTFVALLDSGVDMKHPDFRNEDGSTRIAVLWDQTIPGNPPFGFEIGSVYEQEDINELLGVMSTNDASTSEEEEVDYMTSRNMAFALQVGADGSGHGTAVLGIMAGNGNSSEKNIVGVAPETEIIAVKLQAPTPTGFPRTTQLMEAVDFAIRYASQKQKPIAINISYGNNYGAHNGESILERYLDTVANLYRNVIVAGTGNEGIAARHIAGLWSNRLENERIEIEVSEYVQAFNLQIWKDYVDEFDIILESPDFVRIGPFSPFSMVQEYRLPRETLVVYYGEPLPYNPKQEIYLSWIPNETWITPGIWSVYLVPRSVVSGNYEMWLPVAGSTTAEVQFLRPTLPNSQTIPSTGRYLISVAAYDSRNDTYAPFSGRGSVSQNTPTIAAPGVEINSCRAGGGYGLFTGTSFAAPFVTGAAALLMEYGIVNGNDPYLYGEKVRASLIRGARKLPFQEQRPDVLAGWGALCIRNSIE